MREMVLFSLECFLLIAGRLGGRKLEETFCRVCLYIVRYPELGSAGQTRSFSGAHERPFYFWFGLWRWMEELKMQIKGEEKLQIEGGRNVKSNQTKPNERMKKLNSIENYL